MSAPTIFALSAITQRIQQILQPAIGKTFWVKAEISSGRERGGSFYCDLVETNAQGQIIAQIKCTIWSRDLIAIRKKFQECNLSLTLDNGTLLGLQCSVTYTPKFGLSLCATDADPALALGALEIKKKQILNRLDQEGLFEPNKVCRVPALPLHIGLVTSADSAAYNDFVKTLRLSGFGFKIYLADAAMQGERTQATVLKALETLERLPMDVVVIIRGGGSKIDLFYLDNETIARRIAAFKHPVWTGIGHEIDVGVLDYVANRAFKTPTAVAEALVVRFREMAAHLEMAQNRFRTTWAYRRGTALRYLLEGDAGIRQGTRKLLDISIAALGGKANQLSSLVTKRLSGEKARLAVAERVLSTAPLTVMQQSKALVLEWERRIRNLGQRLLLERGAGLHRLALRFRQERFARQLIDQQAWVQDCKIRLMHVFKRRMLAYQHEQDRFSKKFQLGYVLKPLLAEQNALDAKSSTLKAYDPQNSLKRGFALLYTIDGQLITSVQGIRAGQPTQTTLYDGQVISTVERIEGTLK